MLLLLTVRYRHFCFFFLLFNLIGQKTDYTTLHSMFGVRYVRSFNLANGLASKILSKLRQLFVHLLHKTKQTILF